LAASLAVFENRAVARSQLFFLIALFNGIITISIELMDVVANSSGEDLTQ
jgi:hypothetical protein